MTHLTRSDAKTRNGEIVSSRSRTLRWLLILGAVALCSSCSSYDEPDLTEPESTTEPQAAPTKFCTLTRASSVCLSTIQLMECPSGAVVTAAPGCECIMYGSGAGSYGAFKCIE